MSKKKASPKSTKPKVTAMPMTPPANMPMSGAANKMPNKKMKGRKGTM